MGVSFNPPSSGGGAVQSARLTVQDDPNIDDNAWHDIIYTGFTYDNIGASIVGGAPGNVIQLPEGEYQVSFTMSISSNDANITFSKRLFVNGVQYSERYGEESIINIQGQNESGGIDVDTFILAAPAQINFQAQNAAGNQANPTLLDGSRSWLNILKLA